MKIITIILSIMLLFSIVVLTVACSKIVTNNQAITNNQVTADATLDDQNLDKELVSDPLEENIGMLDELPVDDSIPE